MSTLAQVEPLVEDWAPRIRQAFLEAVAAMAARVPLADVVAALARGDVEAALRAVGLEPAALRALDGAVAAAYASGGDATAGSMPALRDPGGARLMVLFDTRNLRAESWLRNHATTLVREVLEDQKEAVRQHLVAGMAAGTNPRRVAQELVGAVNPQTKKREGGVIGLTASQEAWVRNYADELAKLSPAALARGLRDKRFDASVAKAIRTGEPLSPDKVDKMVAAYRNRALKHRADALARTEAMAALGQAQNEAVQQAIDQGRVRAENVTKTWRSAADTRVRHTHRALNGVRVGFNQSFQSESGARLRYPGDPEAPAAERVNCRCTMSVRIDFMAQAA